MARVIPHPQHSTPKILVKIQIVLPLQIFSNGIAYSTTGTSTVTSSLVNLDRFSVCIGEVACQNHDKINQGPNATTATGEQLCYCTACLAGIETMNTQTTQKEAEQRYN